MTCQHCGADIPAGFRFCGTCGESVPDISARRDQRRTATLVFADMDRALTDELDAEVVLQLMREYVEEVGKIVDDLGGVLDKYSGDALMAVFGAPVSKGDDPARAARSALAMRGAFAPFAARVKDAHGIDVGICIGVNTGRVLWGGPDRGTVAGNITVVGDAVNIASRFQHAARAGHIIVGESTWRHLQRQFELEEMEALAVKGRTNPVRVFELHDELAQPSRDIVDLPPTPFVGRDNEQAVLDEEIEQVVQTGESRAVTILGGAGLGKSRLLGMFRQNHEAQGNLVLVARAAPFGRGDVWAPWTGVFQRAAGLHKVEVDEQQPLLHDWVNKAAGPVEPEWLDILDILAGVTLLDDDAKPPKAEAVAEAVVGILRGVTAKDALVICGDDLHWWSDSSVRLLAAILEGVPRCLVVVSLRESIEGWPPTGMHDRALKLHPLTPGDVAQIVQGMLGTTKSLPAGLASRIHDLSAGNPFFIEETVNSLRDKQILYERDGRWRLDDHRLDEAELPQTVEAVLQGRFDELSPDEQRCLKKAATAGRVFWLRLLAEGMDEPRAGDLLQSLTEKGLVYKRHGSRLGAQLEYTFKQGLVRELAYENTLRKDRIKYHRQVADWLARVAGSAVARFADELAEHYLKGEDFEDAIPLLVIAGETALEAGDTTRAEDRLDEALRLLGKHESPYMSARAYTARGRARRRTGNNDGAIADLSAARVLAEQLGNFERSAEVSVEAAGVCLQRSEIGAVDAHAHAALEAARKVDSKKWEAVALNLLAIVSTHRGNVEQAMERYRQALEIDTALGNRGGVGARLANMGSLMLREDEYGEAIEFLRSALAEPLKAEFVPVARSNLGLALLLAGRSEEALEQLHRAVMEAERIDYRMVVSEGKIRLGAAYALAGQETTGFPMIAAGVALAEELNAHEQRAEAYWLRAKAHRLSGRTDDAREDLETCLTYAKEKGLETLARRALEGLDELSR